MASKKNTLFRKKKDKVACFSLPAKVEIINMPWTVTALLTAVGSLKVAGESCKDVFPFGQMKFPFLTLNKESRLAVSEALQNFFFHATCFSFFLPSWDPMELCFVHSPPYLLPHLTSAPFNVITFLLLSPSQSHERLATVFPCAHALPSDERRGAAANSSYEF